MTKKKKRLVLLLSAIIVVCGLTVGTLYLTGVISTQVTGSIENGVNVCGDPKCECHTFENCQNNCNKCPSCYLGKGTTETK